MKAPSPLYTSVAINESGNDADGSEMAPGSASAAQQTLKPLWTTEVKVYLGIVVVAVASMLWIGVSMSSSDLPNYANYQRFLSKGWFLGRPIDNSDIQFRSFRNNIPYLILAMVAHLALGRVFTKRQRVETPVVRAKETPATPSRAGIEDAPSSGLRSPVVLSDEEAAKGAKSFAIYNIVFAVIFLTVLHGTSIIKILVEVGLNYAIARQFKGSQLNPILTWVLALVLLWWNERGGAQGFGTILPALAFLVGFKSLEPNPPLPSDLLSFRQDSFKGMMSRWFVTFNLTNLRMISFNMDYYWSFHGAREAFAAHQRKCETCSQAGGRAQRCDRGRAEEPLDPADYSFVNYAAYALYTPLFLAGPIMTFNDFMSQARRPLSSTNTREVVRYAGRWIANLLVMEIMLHYIYVVAMIRAKAYDGLSPAQIGMVGYFNLKYIWLKLLLIWRFFRMWSLADGIDPPENMHRCMSNNYSAAGFWRSWHRSYNRWLIRYMYIPLGGSQRRLISMPIIFTFVGFWHDRSFTLLAWAWLIILFLLPEGLATAFFGGAKWTSWKYFKYLAGLGGVANILMMMVANLVGFAVGVEGIQRMLSELLTLNGEFVCEFVSFAAAASQQRLTRLFISQVSLSSSARS